MSCPFCTPSNRSEPVDLSEFYVDDDPDPAPSPASPAETREGREALAQQIEAERVDPEDATFDWYRGINAGLDRAAAIVRAASPAVSLPGEQPGGEQLLCLNCRWLAPDDAWDEDRCPACSADNWDLIRVHPAPALPGERADEEGQP